MTTTVVGVVTMTDARHGARHYLTDDAASAGRGTGRYIAVCGAEILAASISAPDGRACPWCASWGMSR